MRFGGMDRVKKNFFPFLLIRPAAVDLVITWYCVDDELFLLALFPATTIVRDPHHRESPTRRKSNLNLCRTCVQS